MVNGGDPNNQSWQIIKSLIKLNNYAYKVDLLEIFNKCQKYKHTLNLNTSIIQKIY